MPIPNINHCRVCFGELWRTKAAPPATTVAHFEPESAREQGLAKLGMDGRGREDFDFIIQLLAEALGGKRIKGKSDDNEAGRQPVRCREIADGWDQLPPAETALGTKITMKQDHGED